MSRHTKKKAKGLEWCKKNKTKLIKNKISETNKEKPSVKQTNFQWNKQTKLSVKQANFQWNKQKPSQVQSKKEQEINPFRWPGMTPGWHWNYKKATNGKKPINCQYWSYEQATNRKRPVNHQHTRKRSTTNGRNFTIQPHLTKWSWPTSKTPYNHI